MIRTATRAALHQRWFVNLAARGRQRGVDAGLDPQIAAALEFERIAGLPALETMEPAAARAYAETGLAPLDLDPAPMDRVTDATVPGPAGAIPVRIFVPPEATRDWIVYFHGGGGVFGSVRASEPMARYLAARTRATVASVEYRLGPEHKHPAAIDDAVAAWQALAARVPPGGRAAVGGDSFGGYLAAHVDHATRTRGLRRPDVQQLIYPVVDLTVTSPSIARNGRGYLLTEGTIRWCLGHYLHATDDPRAASPWFWPPGALAGAAPALVATAGFDPLVDEGDAWARRLADEGAVVRHLRFPSLVHGFVSLAGAVDAARAALDEVCDVTAELLGGR